MASNSINQLSLNLLSTFFGINKNRSGFNIRSSNSFGNLIRWDSFSSSSSTQTIQNIVKKMQEALSKSSASARSAFSASFSGSTTTQSGGLTVNHSVTSQFSLGVQGVQIPEPTEEEIAKAVNNMGGQAAVSRWAVDGKTKIDVNGHKIVAQVGQSSGKAEGESTDARAELEKSLKRFGVDASLIDKAPDRLREQLKNAAAQAQQKEPHLSLAIEYALEDAYAKVNAYENSVSGKTNTGVDYESQRKTNQGQAASIASQLNLGDGTAWGIQSLAEDLAVFGMDFSAMSEDAYDLAESIRTKSKQMLEELNTRYVGTEAEFIQERNRITGASARLINGIESAAGMQSASSSLGSLNFSAQFSFSAQATTTVSVGGSKVDASFIIAAGNVIVDPLVLDLNGDGIDLSAAEEGVMFDMSGNGEQAATGFVRGDDAFLFMDTHGDGIVHDGRQLFGNQDGYANGFEMLRQYDDNGDGVIDENDAIYDKLMVWQEKKEDGVCEADETMSLREAGIKSINLGYENVREDDGKGNLVSQNGSFTRDDGSNGYAADVWLRENRGITV